MMFKETVNNHMKFTKIICEQNAKFRYVEDSGTYKMTVMKG